MAKVKKDLTKGPVLKNLLMFAFPLFLSSLLQAFYGSADAIIVGRFAQLGDITGVTQGSQVTYILTNTISAFSTGGAVLIAQYLGAKKEKDFEEIVNTLFTFFVYCALGFTALLLCTNRLILRALAVQPEAIEPFLWYLRICEIGITFIFLYNCISAVLQAMGDAKHPLMFVGIATVVNVVLDLVLVAGLKMGAKGAALATVFAQLISVVLSALFLRRQNFPFKFSINSLKIYPDKLRGILKLGLPYAVQRVFVSISFLAVSGLSNPYGLAAGSAAGIVNKINNFVTLPYSAMQSAITTMTAQSIGAGNLKRGKKAFTYGFGISLIFGITMCVAAHVWPQVLLGVFSDDAELIAVGADFLKAYSLEYPTMAFTWTAHAFFTGCGHTLIPSIDGILASFVFRIPLALFFSKKMGMGYPGIAFGSAMAIWGAVVPAVIFLVSGVWKKSTIDLEDHK